MDFLQKRGAFLQKIVRGVTENLQKPRIILQKTQNVRISADFLQKNACRPADFGFRRLQHSVGIAENRQKLQKITFCLQNIKSNCTDGVFWFTITSAGREALEWRYIDALAADARYIVPIVSNPDLQGIGALLRVQKTRGKIPSVKDALGRVVCLREWQTRDTTGAELQYWLGDPDFGYGFRTGHGGYIAIDCDIDDPEICSAVLEQLAAVLDINWREMPVRTHGSAARWATIVRIEGLDTLPKHVLKWTDDSGNKIEFLGTGQQLVCAGRHPSGDHYRWSCPPFPARVMTQEQFKEFIKAIRDAFPIQVSRDTADPIRVKGKTFLSIDRMADWLRETGRVIGTGPEGQLYIDCPWEDAHTMEGGPGETVYFPVGSNGYLGGGFKCLHSHCSEKTTADFFEWARSQGFEQTKTEEYPDETESAKASESLKQSPAPQGKLAVDKDGKGGLLTMAEFLDIIREDPALSGVQLNDFCGQIEFTKPVPWNKLDPKDLPASGRYFIKDADYTYFRCYIEENYGLKIRINDYPKAFEALAQEQRYHPIKQYLDNLPEWDGVKRVDTLLHDYLGTDDNAYTREVMRKTLCAAYMRIYHAGIKYDTMPVLNGPQGIGKSTLLAKLGGEWFNDNVSLLGIRDKTAVEGLQQGWIIELSEVDGGIRRSDIEAVKAFISRTDDRYRPAYGRALESHPRQCVFFGTANAESGYLSDPTGNRRFLNIPCRAGAEKHPWDLTDEEVRQIWAEVRQHVQDGEDLLLSPEAQKTAKREQDMALETDETEGVIVEFAKRNVPDNWDNLSMDDRRAWLANPIAVGMAPRPWICTLEVWCDCYNQQRQTMKQGDSRKIGAALIKLGWRKGADTEKRKCGPYGMQRVFFNPDVKQP